MEELIRRALKHEQPHDWLLTFALLLVAVGVPTWCAFALFISFTYF